MNKSLFTTILLLCLGCGLLNAQDLIHTTDGRTIRAVVHEINSEVVAYQMFDVQSGPYLDINCTEVTKIDFASGFSQTFVAGRTPTSFDRSTDKFPGMLTCKATKMYLDGQRVPVDKVWEVLGYQMYTDNYRESERKWIIGRRVTYVGIGCIAAAGAVTACDYLGHRDTEITVSEWTTEFSVGLAAIGCVTTISGLVLSSIGKKQVKDICKWYNNDHRKYPELSIGATPSGAGLALNF